MKQKVVLAFSGGLDTSFCVPWLINEKGLEVHTVIVNTGASPMMSRNALKSVLSHWVPHHTHALMLLMIIMQKASGT